VGIVDTLKQSIERANVSRYEISKQTGIEQSTLSRFMSGERKPSIDAIERLCKYFNLELRPGKRPGK
jgi:transcriptional regulator with XRE-family HTH domain